MGSEFKGGTDHYHSLSENIPSITSDYPLSNGYFGTHGNSNDNKVRHIASDDPSATALDFYNKIAHGGKEEKLYDSRGNVKGAITSLSDGTIITWRETSSSDGSPAIDINIYRSNSSSGLKTQKIHFVKE
ncbi:MAG: hypothetical protein IKN80_02540 [Clostridiales bacterium]|nr:hypothetical protein [Clostridiales bacterium]